MKHFKDIICKILDKPIGAILLTIFTGGAIKKIIKACKKKHKVKPEKKEEETQVTEILIIEKEDKKG